MMALRKMRPICFSSPEPAIPATSVPNSSGATMDLISVRNTLLTGASFDANPGATSPSTTPATIPIKIQTVNDGRFNVLLLRR